MVETNIVAVVYECLKHPLFKILCVGAPTSQKKHPQKPKTADSLPLFDPSNSSNRARGENFIVIDVVGPNSTSATYNNC